MGGGGGIYENLPGSEEGGSMKEIGVYKNKIDESAGGSTKNKFEVKG